MLVPGLTGAVTAFAVTLGLLALAVALLRRLHGGGRFGGARVPLRVLQRAQVAPKQSVALLQVGERVLVVSLGESGSALLTELSADVASRAIAPPSREPVAVTEPHPFRTAWRAATSGRRSPVVGSLLAIALTLTLAHSAGAQVVSSTTIRSPGLTMPTVSVAQTPAPPSPAVRAPAPPKVDLTVGEGSNALHLSGAVGIVVFLGVLTLLPALFLLMTSFTRILIVLHFVRSAIGAQTTPPSQLLVAIAVLLTGVIMRPVIEQTNHTAVQPYLAGQITQGEAYTRALQPFRAFMLDNVRERDIETFTSLSGDDETARSIDDVPTVTVVSAFVTSELRTAFQMGFVIFLPFIVVDLIVASVLMSLGMFMLPPVMISLPFKLLLFVLADGWTLVVQNLVHSFR